MKYIASVIALAAAVAAQAPQSVSVTPHEQFSSSIGVLGCMIDTNRVAYFPSFPDCTNMCLKVTSGANSLNLLHIDESGGAFDISCASYLLAT